MSRPEAIGPGPWRGDEQIPTRRQRNDTEEVVTQRQVRMWPDGGMECRDVVEVRRADGTIETFERTAEFPNYHPISGGVVGDSG